MIDRVNQNFLRFSLTIAGSSCLQEKKSKTKEKKNTVEHSFTSYQVLEMNPYLYVNRFQQVETKDYVLISRKRFSIYFPHMFTVCSASNFAVYTLVLYIIHKCAYIKKHPMKINQMSSRIVISRCFRLFRLIFFIFILIFLFFVFFYSFLFWLHF